MKKETKQQKRDRRHRRVRAKVFGTARCPRLCVFRSSKHIYAQVIDDEKGKTIAAANDQEIKKPKGKSDAKRRPEAEPKGPVEDRKAKIAIAYEVGKLLAENALKKKVKKVVFDRGGYKYHGRVKALAEGAREGGLQF